MHKVKLATLLINLTYSASLFAAGGINSGFSGSGGINRGPATSNDVASAGAAMLGGTNNFTGPNSFTGGGNVPSYSSLNTTLCKNLVDRILNSNSPPVKILFIGDSMSESAFGRPFSMAQTFISDLQSYGRSNWRPFYNDYGSFSGIPDPTDWVGTNWWVNTYIGLTAGTYQTYGTYVNVDTIEFAWIQNPVGNSNLGIYTNSVLMTTVSGTNSIWRGAYTNITVPVGTYSIYAQTVSGNGTNLPIQMTAYNSSQGGCAFYYTAQGGSTITNILQCTTNVLWPIYGGINPDIIVWDAKDLGESGSAAGQRSAFQALHDTLSAVAPKAVWVIAGTPDNGVQDGIAQNSIYRAMCLSNNWVYVDTWIPNPNYTSFYSTDGVHVNSYGARIRASELEYELGISSSMLTKVLFPVLSTSPTNIVSGTGTPVAVTVGASPFSFTNTTGARLECHVSGTIAYSVTKNAVAIYGSLAGDCYVCLQTNAVIAITYGTAPTLFTNAW